MALLFPDRVWDNVSTIQSPKQKETENGFEGIAMWPTKELLQDMQII